VRAAPQRLRDLEAWLARGAGAAAALELQLSVRIPYPERSCVIVHRGALETLTRAGTGPVLVIGLQAGRLVVEYRDSGGDVTTGLRSRRLRPGWQRLTLTLTRVPSGELVPVAAALAGRALRQAPLARWTDVHGELASVATITLGGARDRAGGHTDLRFGERRGELITHFAMAVPGAAPTQTTSPVWWDHGDRIEVAPQPTPTTACIADRVLGFALDAHGTARRIAAPRRSQRSRAVPVFAPGYHGYAAYRIPAIVRAGNGDLLAFAEGRVEGISDACRTKDLVLRRSRDGGHSWDELQVVASAPLGPGARSLMNPSPVVAHRGAERIVLVGSWLAADEWALARGEGRGSLLAWTSSDHGYSWSTSRDVSEQLQLPAGLERVWQEAGDWRIQVATLGHAIELQHGPYPGRLCFVGHGTFGAASVFESVGYLFWSDDGGVHWTTGPAITSRADGTPARGWNESTLAELADGSLLLNARQYRDARPVGVRAGARVTWNADGSARVGPVFDDAALPDSGVQASLLRVDAAGQERLAFCNPAHPSARLQLTLRCSVDGGRSWPGATHLVAGRVGYSDLVDLGAGRVGVLYEHGLDGAIDFVAVPLSCS